MVQNWYLRDQDNREQKGICTTFKAKNHCYYASQWNMRYYADKNSHRFFNFIPLLCFSFVIPKSDVGRLLCWILPFQCWFHQFHLVFGFWCNVWWKGYFQFFFLISFWWCFFSFMFSFFSRCSIWLFKCCCFEFLCNFFQSLCRHCFHWRRGCRRGRLWSRSSLYHYWNVFFRTSLYQYCLIIFIRTSKVATDARDARHTPRAIRSLIKENGTSLIAKETGKAVVLV